MSPELTPLGQSGILSRYPSGQYAVHERIIAPPEFLALCLDCLREATRQGWGAALLGELNRQIPQPTPAPPGHD